MVTEHELKEIEQSDEVRLYRLRKGTRQWREKARTWGAFLMVIGITATAGSLALAWAVHIYPPDTTEHYVKTGELNETAAKLVEKITSSQSELNQWFPFVLFGAALGLGGVMLWSAAPDKKDIEVFDDALELYISGKCKDTHPKFCPECGKNLRSKE